MPSISKYINRKLDQAIGIKPQQPIPPKKDAKYAGEVSVERSERSPRKAVLQKNSGNVTKPADFQDSYSGSGEDGDYHRKTGPQRDLDQKKRDSYGYPANPPTRYAPTQDRGKSVSHEQSIGQSIPNDPRGRYNYGRNQSSQAGAEIESSSEEDEEEEDTEMHPAVVAAQRAYGGNHQSKRPPPPPPRRSGTNQPNNPSSSVGPRPSSRRNDMTSGEEQSHSHKSTSWLFNLTGKRKPEPSSEFPERVDSQDERPIVPMHTTDDDVFKLADGKRVPRSSTADSTRFHNDKEVLDDEQARNLLYASSDGKFVTGVRAYDDSYNHGEWGQQRMRSIKRFKDANQWKQAAHSDTEDPFDWIADKIKRASMEASKTGLVPENPTKYAAIDEALRNLCATLLSSESFKLSGVLEKATSTAEISKRIPDKISADPSLNAAINKFLVTMLWVQRLELADALETTALKPSKNGRLRIVFPQWKELDEALGEWFEAACTVQRKALEKNWAIEKGQLESLHASKIEKIESTHSEECETYQDQLQRSRTNHDSDVRDLERRLTGMADSQAQEKARYDAAIEKLEDEKAVITLKLRTESTRLVQEAQEAAGKIRIAHEKQLLKKDEEREIDRQDFDKRLEKVRATHESEILDRDTEIQTLTSDYNARITKAREVYDAAMRQKESEKDAIRDDWMEKYRELKESSQREYAELKQLHENKTAQHESDTKRLISSHKKKEEEIQEAAKRKAVQTARAHKVELNKQKAVVEDIKSRVTARDHFKGLGDDEVVSKFADVYVEIDDLANTDWVNSKKLSWPCSEAILQRAENDRILRKDVLLNGFWQILFKGFFSSPFAPLGDDGKRLEAEWANEFGKDPTSNMFPDWPSPSESSEKWRSEKVSAALDIVKRGSNQNFNSMVKKIARSLRKTLEDVTEVDQELADMCQTAAEATGRLWLEYASQRCRLMLVVPKSSTVVKPGKENALVTRPEIRRIGNSVGTVFDQEEVLRNGKLGLNRFIAK